MKITRAIALTFLGLGVSACANVETATRNAPLTVPVEVSVANVAPSVRVTGYKISIPDNLRVSEAELYYPMGDIVWRGDPIGDRFQQVKDIFSSSVLTGTHELNGVVPVVLDIEVLRFHALTNKARYTVGGVHSMKFNLTVRNPETGAILVPTRKIEADLKAFGGQKAILADRRGQTQKVRITGHLANVINKALTEPVAPKTAPVVARHLQKTVADQI